VGIVVWLGVDAGVMVRVGVEVWSGVEEDSGLGVGENLCVGVRRSRCILKNVAPAVTPTKAMITTRTTVVIFAKADSENKKFIVLLSICLMCAVPV
jgi:hypothetical protein